MPKIYLCFVWHMHQPFYRDLISGEYHLPWTRLHALKDYYGMVKVLEDFPAVHQTFNLVPSMMVQIQEYATGKAADPFLRAAVTPAESLSSEQYDLILRYFFQAHPSRLIRRYPRYGELYDVWLATASDERARRQFFTPQAIRDLQVLSQLAWFDEEFLANDAEIRSLLAKVRDYSLDDQALMARKQQLILGAVLPVYREFARRGQIEITTTPFYHPILPLANRRCRQPGSPVAHAFPLSRGRPRATRSRPCLHGRNLRRRSARSMAFRGLRLRSGFYHRRRLRVPLGRYRQRRSNPHAESSRRYRRNLSSLSVATTI
jgi:alpha-amylase/alpha-mannosidase (GH57 family)